MIRPCTVHESLYLHETGLLFNTTHLVNETRRFQNGSSVLLIRLSVLDSSLLLLHVNVDLTADKRLVFVPPPDINECESQPCLNGGECVDQVANFTCICPAGFTGMLCETGDLNSAPTLP